MVKRQPHLELPAIKDSFKKKSGRGGPLPKIKRDYTAFSTEQISRLNSLSSSFASQPKKYDYSQELVFKLKTAQRVPDEQFRIELKRAGVETLISNPGKKTEWILSTTDPNFSKLKEKIQKRAKKDKADFIDGIETFAEFTDEDKKGFLLKQNPLGRIETTKLHVSLTRKETDVEGQKINYAIDLIVKLADDRGFRVFDKLLTDNLCILLVECNNDLLNEILKIDLVTEVDRTPEFHLEDMITKDLEDLQINNTSPPEDAHGVLVMDSGIILHPLLVNAVDQNGIVGLPDRPQEDDKNHGTMVSGNALYGNIEKSVPNGFNSDVWIYSAKVFYQSGNRTILDENRLFVNIIKESIEEIKTKFPRCRVINLSFGDRAKIMLEGRRQFELAALIDELSVKYADLIFVISMGNILDTFYRQNQFPDYLCQNIDEIKIIDPATSVHAISVGALQDGPDGYDLPSNITRTGPGLNQMIKPELVELGGGFHKPIVVLNPDFRQRTFTINAGTSFSAPIICSYLARLMNQFPTASRNLINALLISSTKLPKMPSVFPALNSSTNNTQFLQITNVYGYGKPSFDDASTSDENRVVFKHDGSINIDHVNYFTINLPDEFVNEKGDKTISVTLVFDPPIRESRADYFGTRMEFHLFRNRTVDEIKEKYNLLDLTKDSEEEDTVPEELKKDEIKFKPSNTLRKRTTHQKGVAKLSTRYKINNSNPLVLAVICQKKWKMNENATQNFAAVVTLNHSKEIDLYNKIQVINQAEVRPRVRL